ncbi:MAG: ABC transporter permease [Acidobacteria bacterium]|nr:ABC transporter permease [Acidobacteriota bacterium]
MQNLLTDIKYGFRMLWKYKIVSVIAIITLALGIGANSAIFSIVNTVLLKPLPYEKSEDLVFISEKSAQIDNMSVAYPNFLDWRAQNKVFERIGVFRNQSYSLINSSGEAEQVAGVMASLDLFLALKVNPLIGRNFLVEEDKPGANPVVLLSYGFWQQNFAARESVLGEKLTLNGQNYTIIGIMPKSFQFPTNKTQLWVPVGLNENDPNWIRENHPGLYAIARLKSGVNLLQAQAEMSIIAAQLEKQYPKSNPDNKVAIKSAYERIVGQIRTPLFLLLASVGAVLLIACANVANLLLAKSVTRNKEIAIRSVLGANRMRIIRQLLTESLILALVGGTLGLLLATWGVSAIISFPGLDSVPRMIDVKVDGQVLIFTLILSCATGVIFGLVPALQSTKLDLNESLKESNRATTGSCGQNKLRSILIVAEITFTLILLISSGLFIKSFVKLQQVDAGFKSDNILIATLSLPKTKYPEPEQKVAFYQELLTRLATIPGVESVASSNRLPLQNAGNQTSFFLEDFPQDIKILPSTEYTVVPPSYFKTLSIKLLSGRVFTEQDRKDSLPVVIIDEKFAKKYWPNQNPIGKKIKGGDKDSDDPWMEVVGVVASIRYDELSEGDNLVQMYRPYYQSPSSRINLAIKVTGDTLSYTGILRKEVLSLDKELPIYDVKTFSQLVENSIAPEKLLLVLLGIFASVALILASVGVYGVISYSVSQRTHEIGIRMALGAQSEQVVMMIVKQGMTLALIGIGIGLLGAFLLTRVMTSLLYEVSTTDPTIFI